MTHLYFCSIIGALLLLLSVYAIFLCFFKRQTTSRPQPPKALHGYIATLKSYTGYTMHEDMRRWGKEVGCSVFKIKFLHRPASNIFMCGDIDLLKKVMQNKSTIRSEPFCSALAISNHLGGNDIISSKSHGMFWKHSRKNIRNAFSSKNLQTIKHRIDSAVEDFIQNTIDHFASNKTPFDFAEVIHPVIMRIICDTGFEYQITPEETSKYVQNKKICAMEMRLLLAFPLRKHIFFLPSVKKSKTAAQSMLDLGNRVIETYRKNPNPTKGTILDCIMKNDNYRDDAERLNDIITMFAAAKDTTANAISWILINLARHPREQKYLQSELQKLSEEEQASSKALKNVIQESLRMNTSLPILMERHYTGTEDIVFKTKVQGIEKELSIPGGSFIVPNLHMVGRNEDRFDAVDVFDPSRWDRYSKEDAANNIPFGTGERSCVGLRFANLNMYTIIPRLLRDYTFSLNQDAISHSSVTNYPKGGILIAARNTSQ